MKEDHVTFRCGTRVATEISPSRHLCPAAVGSLARDNSGQERILTGGTAPVAFLRQLTEAGRRQKRLPLTRLPFGPGADVRQDGAMSNQGA
jgi:hypothetical protein